jgi:hypothetical protein
VVLFFKKEMLLHLKIIFIFKKHEFLSHLQLKIGKLTIKTEIPVKKGSIHHFPQAQSTATEKRIEKYALVEGDVHKETFHGAITLQISTIKDLAYSNIICCGKKPIAEESMFIIYQASKFSPQEIRVFPHRIHHHYFIS